MKLITGLSAIFVAGTVLSGPSFGQETLNMQQIEQLFEQSSRRIQRHPELRGPAIIVDRVIKEGITKATPEQKPELKIDYERSLLVRNPEILKLITFSDIMKNISAVQGNDGVLIKNAKMARELFAQWWRTAGPMQTIEEKDRSVLNCNGRQTGVETFFDYADYTCGRDERELASMPDKFIDEVDDPGNFIIIAAVNRLDLAVEFQKDAKGDVKSTCGEFRLVVTNRLKKNDAEWSPRSKVAPELPVYQKVSIIFEAAIPYDPKTEMGKCTAIQKFWLGLGSKNLGSVLIGERLKQFFIDGIAINAKGEIANPDDNAFTLKPVMRRETLGGTSGESGQIRTNILSSSRWLLRQYRFSATGEKLLLPSPLAGNFEPKLLKKPNQTDKNMDARIKAVADIVGSAKNTESLRSDNINKLGFETPKPIAIRTLAYEAFSTAPCRASYYSILHTMPEKCGFKGETRIRDALSKLANKIPLLDNGGETADMIIQKRLGASSCAGCHRFIPDALGNLGFRAQAFSPAWIIKDNARVLWLSAEPNEFVHIDNKLDQNTGLYKISGYLKCIAIPFRIVEMKKYLGAKLSKPSLAAFSEYCNKYASASP
ncbi:MAG: hypothetical protein GY748_17080 [Planctomycetaceae bacterium]|nr:hypothetical protein [Planctomycetaceae bacterium]